MGSSWLNKGIAEIQLAPNNTPTGNSRLTGDFKVGKTISIDALSIEDADNNEYWTPAYQYSWEVSSDNGINWTILTSADATDGDDSYTLTSEESGQQLRGVVSYIDGYGTNEVVESGSERINQPFVNLIGSVYWGRGRLRGTKHTDQFTFEQFESFGAKTADKIIGFKSSQGDTIGVSAEAFPSLQGADEITFASAKNKKQLKVLGKGDYDFVYYEKKGRLFFNGNGSDKGWGDPFEGGLFAILKGKPELSVDDFTLLA